MNYWKYRFLVVSIIAVALFFCGCGESRDTGIRSIQRIEESYVTGNDIGWKEGDLDL